MGSKKALFLALLFLSLSSGLSAAWAGSPKCFMHGIISPLNESAGDKQVLSDMIRLHMDATTQDKCEQLMASYCRYNVLDKGYSPTRLKGSFKIDVDKPEEVIYRFSSKCKMETEN